MLNKYLQHTASSYDPGGQSRAAESLRLNCIWPRGRLVPVGLGCQKLTRFYIHPACLDADGTVPQRSRVVFAFPASAQRGWRTRQARGKSSRLRRLISGDQASLCPRMCFVDSSVTPPTSAGRPTTTTTTTTSVSQTPLHTRLAASPPAALPFSLPLPYTYATSPAPAPAPSLGTT